MARESTIQVFRSSTTVTPTGLTFGELAFSDVAGAQRLWVGTTAGASLWIGAGVTDGGLATNSSVLVPTQSAVKSYVDGVVGGGSVVNSVNNASGAIVVTGDNGAILKTTSSGTNTFTARVATASLTGVASFPTGDFTVTSGAVNLKDVVRSVNGLTGAVTVTGDGSALFGYGNGTIGARNASTSVTGVASFNSTYFTVSAAGAVALAAGYQVTGDTVSAGTGIQVTRSGNTATVTNTGILSINGLTGIAATITGDGGAASVVIGSGIAGASQTWNVTSRLATTSLTGVASFNSTDFSVAAGAVTLNTTKTIFALRDEIQSSQNYNFGDTITLTGGQGINVYQTAKGNFAFRGATATTTLAGVASFPTADFTVTSGAVNLKDVVRSVNGLTGALTITGDGGAVRGVGNNAITTRLAASGVTGLASFNTASFTVDASGDVTIKSGGVSNAQLANSSITIKAGSGEAGQAVSLGSSFSITGTANQVLISRTGTEFTVGIPNDVTIPGNLTVNGTVITANVDNFVVEDPLFMLGTGNAGDTVDLGFYGLYTSSGRNFTGLFRDASDGGKYKLFTGLTGAAEPTTTVNDGAAGYTIATLVAKIDGGTF